MEKLLLDKAEAAGALSVSTGTLARLVKEKKVRELHLGGRRVYRMSDLKDYVERLAAGEFDKKKEDDTVSLAK